MTRRNELIKNIYYMLAYAFKALQEDSFDKIATEEFENVNDLMAAILAKGIENQLRRGVGRSYVETTDALYTPKGKIDIPETIKSCALYNKQVTCTYCEFSKDIYLNRVIKAVAFLLIKAADVEKEHKRSLFRTMQYFYEVKDINPRSIDWKSITFNANNATYLLLVNICQMVVKHLIQTEEEGSTKSKILGEQVMSSLYERFVLEFYKKHFPELKPSASYIDWNVKDGFNEMLPAMKTDVTLHYEDKKAIIDTKYYEHALQFNERYKKTTIHSANLYQIYTYVRNLDVEENGRVRGALLYAMTEEGVKPNYSYLIGSNVVKVKTLDLNVRFDEIGKQLRELVQELFV